MTPEEYATICSIVTEGFVELSIEILALEAHLGGPSHVAITTNPSTTASNNNNPVTTNASSLSPSSASGAAASGTVENATTNSSPEISQRISLNSPEHAQLIREVQLLEKQKLALTVQGQKWFLEKEAQEVQDQQEREAEIQADRIVDGRDDEEDNETHQQRVAVAQAEGQAHANGGIKLSTEEWQAKLDENRDR